MDLWSVNCANVVLNSSTFSWSMSDEQRYQIRRFLRSKGINPDQERILLEPALVMKYKSTNFTPVDFLKQIILNHRDIADIAKGILADIEQREVKVDWVANRGDHVGFNGVIGINAFQTTAVGRTGIVRFLSHLRHELTHQSARFEIYTYDRNMSFDEFYRRHLPYVVADEINAQLAGIQVEVQLIQRGWPGSQVGRNTYVHRMLEIIQKETNPLLLALALTRELRSADYTSRWEKILRDCFEYHALRDYVDQAFDIILTDQPAGERLAGVQAIVASVPLESLRDKVVGGIRDNLRAPLSPSETEQTQISDFLPHWERAYPAPEESQ